MMASSYSTAVPILPPLFGDVRVRVLQQAACQIFSSESAKKGGFLLTGLLFFARSIRSLRIEKIHFRRTGYFQPKKANRLKEIFPFRWIDNLIAALAGRLMRQHAVYRIEQGVEASVHPNINPQQKAEGSGSLLTG
jgi:hypothetical protein